MRVWRFTIVALLTILVQGCGPQYQTFYEYTPPRTAEGRACATQCQTIQTYCRSACKSEENSCKQQERYEARQKYDRYVEKQRASNSKIERTPSSFESYRSCGEPACSTNCEEDFRVCYSTCGGQVKATVRCTSGCDQIAQPSAPARATAPIMADYADHGAASPLCRPGARVEVLWDGEWYAAKVTAPARGDGRCPIHYVGYDDNDDEAVPARRIRKPER